MLIFSSFHGIVNSSKSGRLEKREYGCVEGGNPFFVACILFFLQSAESGAYLSQVFPDTGKQCPAHRVKMYGGKNGKRFC